MKIKKSYIIIIAIFLVLLITYIIMNVLSNRDSNIRDLPTMNIPDKFEIDKITIRKTAMGDILTLTKDENREWNYKYREEKPIKGKARENTILILLNEIERIKPVNVRTRNKDRYISYGVDDASAIFLDVFSTKTGENQTIIVGNTDLNRRTTSIRIPEKSPVYSTVGDVRTVLNKELIEYRDRNIFRYEIDSIVKIYYKYKGEDSVTLIKELETVEVPIEEDGEDTGETMLKKEVKWRNTETNKLFNTDIVNDKVRQISRFATFDFLDYPDEEKINQEPIFELAYYTDYEKDTGESYKITVLEFVEKFESTRTSIENKYLVKIGNQTNPLYWVNREIIDNLLLIRESE